MYNFKRAGNTALDVIVPQYVIIENMILNSHHKQSTKDYYIRIQDIWDEGFIGDGVIEAKFCKTVDGYVNAMASMMYKQLRAFKIEYEDCQSEVWEIVANMFANWYETTRVLIPFVFQLKKRVESRTKNILRDLNTDKRILTYGINNQYKDSTIHIDSLNKYYEDTSFEIADKTAFKAFENIEQRTDKMVKQSNIKLINEAIANEFARECNNIGISLTHRERVILLKMLELGESYKTYSVRAFAEVCSMNQTTMRRERKSLLEKLNIIGIPNRLKSILTAS